MGVAVAVAVAVGDGLGVGVTTGVGVGVTSGVGVGVAVGAGVGVGVGVAIGVGVGLGCFFFLWPGAEAVSALIAVAGVFEEDETELVPPPLQPATQRRSPQIALICANRRKSADDLFLTNASNELRNCDGKRGAQFYCQ